MDRQASMSITQLVKTVANEEADKVVSADFKSIYKRLEALETQIMRHTGTHIHAPIDVDKHLAVLKNLTEN